MNFLGDMVENLHHSTASAHEKGDQVISLLASVEARLADLFEAVTAETDQDEYLPLSFVAQCDGTGAAQATVQRRPGFVAELVSLSVVGSQNNGTVAIYTNDTSPINLLFAGTQNGAAWSSGFPEGSIVPDGSNLVVVIAGAPANTQVAVTLRTSRKMLDRGQMRNVQNV